jgi:hypothetical protein
MGLHVKASSKDYLQLAYIVTLKKVKFPSQALVHSIKQVPSNAHHQTPF